ncbi:MAG TPA: hypothetical protein VMW19_02745 [Myxococcota bacterium]|nr:hypothetical protein [Myxococcota bacterium]
MRRAALAQLAVLALAATAYASSGTTAGDEMQEIYRLSGLEAQVGALDRVVAASLIPNLSRVPAARAGVVRDAVLRAWSTPVLRQDVVDRLAKIHDPQHAAETLRWLRSPLGRRISKLETHATSAEGVQGLEAFSQQLRSHPPDATRLALARALDQATGATDFAVEVSLASGRAAMSAVGAASPEEKRLEPDKIEAAIEAQRQRLHDQLAPASLASTLFTYQSLSDSELETYLAFARGDAGRWYHDAVKQALLGMLTDVSGRMGLTVATALRAAPAPGGPTTPAHRAD